jgi:uncharacterized flavoprotein (TIGR03862 family)
VSGSEAPRVAVIGGGPAGLMAAEVLAQAGVQVDVYEAMPSVARKFLLAGKGGLNITHSEPVPAFLARYGGRAGALAPMLDAFGPAALRDWAHGLGVHTFVGSSGRVFPAEMKAAPLLRAWLHRLRTGGVKFHVRHRWLGWEAPAVLRFATAEGPVTLRADALVLALGGASWPRLGSDGSWVGPLAARGVEVAPLRPANCGFEVAWSEHFRARFAGHPVKTTAASVHGLNGPREMLRGELTVADYGIEGGLVYALAAPLRDALEAHASATLYLDLAPDRGRPELERALARHARGESLANRLRKRAGIDGVKAALVRELTPPGQLSDAAQLASAIKALAVPLRGVRPIDEAISSAGGVRFEAMDERLMLHAVPGVFCAGEMLDWEAPTGGYLLTACLATGRAAGRGALAWLAEQGRIAATVQ